MSASTYSKSGTKATTTVKLDKSVFGLEVDNHELIKHAYVAYLANGRENHATTKTRGMVSGGGKKPWKQKGTGRARFGSSRVPIWRGGGIVFGPSGNENYSQKVNTKAKRQAIRQALSLAAKSGKISIIEDIVIKDGKTSAAAALLSKIGAKRNTLIAVDEISQTVTRPFNNLSNVKMVNASYLNVYDVMNADTIIITTAGVAKIHAWLGEAK